MPTIRSPGNGRQHGAHRSESIPTGRPLAAKFDTVAEILRDHGYWTHAVVSNTAYLSNAFGFGGLNSTLVFQRWEG